MQAWGNTGEVKINKREREVIAEKVNTHGPILILSYRLAYQEVHTYCEL
jgi:hypothetical protein